MTVLAAEVFIEHLAGAASQGAAQTCSLCGIVLMQPNVYLTAIGYPQSYRPGPVYAQGNFRTRVRPDGARILSCVRN